MKISIACEDKYEAQKFASLIFIKEGKETYIRSILNQLRAEKKLSTVKIITVPMFLAKDGKRISTTRIKNSEIDAEGNLLSID